MESVPWESQSERPMQSQEGLIEPCRDAISQRQLPLRLIGIALQADNAKPWTLLQNWPPRTKYGHLSPSKNLLGTNDSLERCLIWSLAWKMAHGWFICMKIKTLAPAFDWMVYISHSCSAFWWGWLSWQPYLSDVGTHFDCSAVWFALQVYSPCDSVFLSDVPQLTHCATAVQIRVAVPAYFWLCTDIWQFW